MMTRQGRGSVLIVARVCAAVCAAVCSSLSASAATDGELVRPVDPLDGPARLAWDPLHTPLEASATLTADGHFTLLLHPDQAWSAAEIVVRGDGTHDLGAMGGDGLVEVAGMVDAVGPLWIELAAVTAQSGGVSWSFEVQPELLPVAAPTLEPTDTGRRRRTRRQRKRAQMQSEGQG